MSTPYPQQGQAGFSVPGYPPAASGYPPTFGSDPGYPGYPPAAPGYVPASAGNPGYPQPPQAAGYPAPGYVPASGSDHGYPGYPQPPQAAGYPAPVAGYPQPQHQMQMAIMQQPTSFAPNPHIPPGLEYLTTLDKLIVKQKVELLEAFTGFETNNKYSVQAANGQKLFYAVEDVDLCVKNCCGTRPFEMKVFDANQSEIAHFSRPLRCESCCCPCCLQKLEVQCPPGNVVGYVIQEWSICTPQFRIENAVGDTVLRIEGPCCTFSICGSVDFRVISMGDGLEVGRISKEWSGLAREIFTDADNFGISFPDDLDVKMKMVMLGACFLIDYMFFEKN